MYYPVWMLVIFLHLTCEQATGAFLQAISAALATIPLTGGPIAMTAGLAGVKLAVGSKLLYYLGFFGRGEKASAPSPIATSSGKKLKHQSSVRHTFPQRYSVPLPYMFAAGGAFRQPQLGMPAQGFPHSYLGQQFSDGQFSQSKLMHSYGTNQATGPDHFLTNSAMYGSQSSYAQTGFPNSVGGSSSFLPSHSEVNAERHVKDEVSTEGSVQLDVPVEANQKALDQMNMHSEGSSESDVDSFFNFLGEMDDNMCISRLLCDIGGDPDFLGEFSQNINSIISSLEVPPDSRANHYVSIMEKGREQRGCAERFGHHCTDSAYEIVKSVAPTVNIPANLEDLNI